MVTTSFRLILSLTTALLSLIMFVGCTPEPVPEPVPVFVEQVVVKPVYHMHTVRFPGETLGIIALWYTKKTANWKDILEANSGLDVRRMSIGTEIRIPDRMVQRTEPLSKSFVERVTSNIGKSTQKSVESTTAAQASPVAKAAEPDVEDAEALEDIEGNEDLSAGKSEEEDAFLEGLLAEDSASAAKAVKNEQPETQNDARATDSEPTNGQPDLKVQTGDSSDLSEDEIDRAELLEELLE
jgi:hypothetical protein